MLAGLSHAGRALDQAFETTGGTGLAEVLVGDARLADVALRPSDRPFHYLPSGGTDEPPAPSLLFSFLDRVRSANGTLLLVVPPDRAGLPRAWFDDEIRLGGFSSGASERWRRHRLVQRLPPGRTAFAAGVVLALFAGWWILARLVTSWAPEASSGALDAQIVSDREMIEEPADMDLSSEGIELPGPDRHPEPIVDSEAASELGYSVLIASYGRLSDARRHLESVSDSSILLFIAPTEIRGGRYYRLFGGALLSRESATALMRRLVGIGAKEEPAEWDVRPAALSFHIGDYADAGSARAVQSELADKGVPTYLISLVANADTVYQVYAGAYERPAAATVMRALLADAGLDADLIPRRGEPR